VIDGVKWDSEREYVRWLVLFEWFSKGLISHLRRQVKYKITHNNEFICVYKADFVYVRNGSLVVEDVKSDFTAKLPVYRLKKKLMKAHYGIEITEIK
jgi:hypothetical protein